MAKSRSRKGRKKGAAGAPWLKVSLITIALMLIAFFSLMQSVRSGMFGELPSEAELKSITHEQATLVLGNDGSLIGKIFAQDRTNVRYADLPKHLIDALVSTEDARFFTHQGVDGRSYVRVFFRTLLGRDKSGGGGSTISQQIIKNLYGRRRHGILTVPVNKMKEALVAQRLERVLTKNDVLVLYFNSVPFGENVFGIEAAAQRFFSKPTKRLAVEESAVLVGMLKANTTYNPRLNPKNAKGRRDQVLQLMSTRGHITSSVLDSLKQLPITLHYAGNSAFDTFGYFNAKVAQEAKNVLKEIADRTGVVHDIEKDGLRITTTIDPVLQRMAHTALRAHLAIMQPKLDKELRNAKARATWETKIPRKGPKWKADAKSITELYDHTGRRVDTLSYRDSLWHYHKLLNGAVLMMDPSSGAVRAWVGGNDHRYLPYDLVQARRPIASTIKPVIYAAALERGMDPCTYLDNEKRTYADFDDWAPDNFDRDTVGGKVAMWYALAKSLNRPTVDLYFRTGQDTVRRTFKALRLPLTDVDKPAVALGASSISLEEIVPAYGAFAMRGKRVVPQLIARITDAQGKVIYNAGTPKAEQALLESTAAGITTMLQRAVNEGTGGPLRSRYGVTGPYAGKTGTSQNYSDAWFIAYTPGLVIGTWVGAFDPEVHFRSSQGTGGHLALPIAAMVLKEIEKQPELRKRYVRPFSWMDDHEVDTDCHARKGNGALDQLLDSMFGTKPAADPAVPQEKKDENFFNKLFKKKQ